MTAPPTVEVEGSGRATLNEANPRVSPVPAAAQHPSHAATQASTANPTMVRRWLGILHGDSPGLIHICSTGDWAGRTFPTANLDDAARYVTYLDGQGREGIYARVTTLRVPLAPGKRGGAMDSHALPALWADMDIAGPGHAEPNLPPDEEAVRHIIASSGLPEPTLWIHSGGGMYPIWLLDTPHTISDDLTDMKTLSANWQKIIEHASAGLGYKYGAGVGDLARVLRIPGTINRKAGRARPCQFVSANSTRYPLDQLQLVCATASAPLAQPVVEPQSSNSNDTRPGDDFNARATWEQILTLVGWHEHYCRDDVTHWTRPGKTTGGSATTNALGTDQLHVFSTSAAPLEGGRSYSKFAAFTILEHGGDYKAAAKALRAKGFGTQASSQSEMIGGILGPPRAAQGQPKQRPMLDVTNPAIAAEQLRANIGCGPLAGLFDRAGHIAFIAGEGEAGYVPPERDGDHDGPAQVRVTNAAGLAAYIDARYQCIKIVKVKDMEMEVPALFPLEAAKRVVDLPDPSLRASLRRLAGVVHTPMVRADGSIFDAPGYDPNTRLYYLPDTGLVVPPVPEQPTRAQTVAAVELLRYMVGDFRWAGQHDQANYLGLLLTPLLRLLVPPPYKLPIITAPQPGSGKSLLAGILRTLFGGVFRSEVPEDDAEWRKQITSILTVTTGPVVQFDNVSGVLRSSTLAGLLTSSLWDDRKLGGNEMISAVNDRLWVVTGNNASLGGDLMRRAMWITIDPGEPDPHLRTGFKIPNLQGWVRERRGELIAALLTLVRAWVAAGRPAEDARGDSYGPWIATVRGMLDVAGVTGNFDHPGSAQQSIGEDDQEWLDFLDAVSAVFDGREWSVAEMLKLVDVPSRDQQTKQPDQWQPARIPLDALPSQLVVKVLGAGTTSAIAKSMGKWLANRAGRWAGRACVRAAPADSHSKIKRWRIDML